MASEAVVFLRLLDGSTTPDGTEARVQFSPDGVPWVDEDTSIRLPSAGEVTFARVRQSGHYLLMVASPLEGVSCTLHATSLKS